MPTLTIADECGETPLTCVAFWRDTSGVNRYGFEKADTLPALLASANADVFKRYKAAGLVRLEFVAEVVDAEQGKSRPVAAFTEKGKESSATTPKGANE